MLDTEPILPAGWAIGAIRPYEVRFNGPHSSSVVVRIANQFRHRGRWGMPRIVVSRPFKHGSRPGLARATVAIFRAIAIPHLEAYLAECRANRAAALQPS